jgi:hypothetical protein
MKKAMLYSALIPGLGELYTHNYTKAGIFFASDIAIVLSYFRFKNENDWAIKSYQQFALVKAGVQLHSSSEHYQLVQNFLSRESYNAYIIRYYRNYYLVYKHDPETYEQKLDEYLIPEEQDWNWETEKDLKKFRNMRQEQRNLETYAKLTVAATILNHLVSIIDSAISARINNKNVSQFQRISLTPDFAQKGFKLNYEIKF